MQTNNKDSKVSYPKTAKQIEAELKEATREIKDLDKQKRSSSFKKLSRYSQLIFEEEYKNAIGKQFDLIAELIDLNLSEKEATAIVKKATK